MFSPAEGKIIGTLQGVHERGIKDFKFSHPDHTEGWSIGGDGKLVQWDLIEGRAIRFVFKRMKSRLER
jgi:U3 small nucleolar RNA-associated protein 5